MKQKKLTRDFFDRPTLTVAKELLGKFLVRKISADEFSATCPAQNREGLQRDSVLCGMITETEAYVGPRDLASHASRGRTPRTEVMFGPPGHAYIYLIYGMYYCFNIVTERDGYPAAVLIRGATLPLTTLQHSQECWSVVRGPGKLCRYFQIDKTLNRENLTTSKKLWLEDRGVKIKSSQIKRGKRIGIDYAGKYKYKLWRFSI